MKNKLECFIERISNFDILPASEKICLFTYFLSSEDDKSVTPAKVNECFSLLSLIPYSNISAYMGSKSTGKNAIFIKNKDGYRLTRNAKIDISSKINDVITTKPTNDLIPLSIVSETRNYIEEISRQMCCCFDYGLYDACFIMMRKLLETLIIDCFERHGVSNEIKENDQFFYLNELIQKYISSSYWNASRNLKNNIGKIKEYGDLSAHNKRFIAKKEHIIKIRMEAEQVIQEIILTIDYLTWNKELKDMKKV